MLKNFCKNNNIGILFVLPAIIGTLIFIIIPILCSFALSFTEWDLLNEIKFIGLENYKTIFNEALFLQILTNTLIFAISTTFFAVIIPLFIASMINSKIKLSELFKTLYFLPFITPAVVVAIVWSWIFDPNIGLVNSILQTNFKWLFDTKLAMPVIIFITVWKLIGYNVILFLTGFSTIPQNIYESAKIDGADEKETFFKITLPLLKPTTYFVTIVTAISSFQVFDLIYVMTAGGPKDSTNIIVYSIYKYAFEYFDIGKACALAYILFAIILLLSILHNKLKKVKD